MQKQLNDDPFYKLICFIFKWLVATLKFTSDMKKIVI